MKIQNLILIGLGVALICIVLFKGKSIIGGDDYDQKTIDSLKNQISLKEQQVSEMEETLVQLNDSIYLYEQKLIKNQRKIKYIENEYKKTMDSLRGLPANGVKDFFTKRYGK